MPRSYMFTKEQVLDAAIELTREKGFSAVSARSLGEQLGTTSRPIFSHFENMADVQKGIIGAANKTLSILPRRRNSKRKVCPVQSKRNGIYPFRQRRKRVIQAALYA